MLILGTVYVLSCMRLFSVSNHLSSPSLQSNRTLQSFWALRPWRLVCIEWRDLDTTLSDPYPPSWKLLFVGGSAGGSAFAWLQFDETKEEMFCTACREFSSLADKNSSFFTGSQAFHIGNIKAHASNRKHEACVLAKQQREQQERGSMNIVQSLRQMSNDTEEKMKKLFNISYFIAKYERPLF